MDFAHFIDHLTAGPRFKSSATRDFEAYVTAVLQSKLPCKYAYNAANQIEVVHNKITYNLTLIIEHMDFEHLEFNDELMACYVRYASTQPALKPYFGACNTSHAENLAIKIYSLSAYKDMNLILRGHSKERAYSFATIEAFLLTAAFAATGLAKLPPIIGNIKLHRKEYTGPHRSQADVGSKIPYMQRGFFSTSQILEPSREHTNIYIHMHTYGTAIGKSIRHLSCVAKEDEVLFPPGTQLIHFKHPYDKSVEYHAIAVRSLDGIDHLAYSQALARQISIPRPLLPTPRMLPTPPMPTTLPLPPDIIFSQLITRLLMQQQQKQFGFFKPSCNILKQYNRGKITTIGAVKHYLQQHKKPCSARNILAELEIAATI